ncbi:MAG: hypothetical protein AAF481_04565 [Acidobacteriota bacterium]
MMLAPASYGVDDSRQEAAYETESPFLTSILDRIRAVLGGPKAHAAGNTDPDPREDDQEDEGDDSDDSGGGILSPGPTMDPGGGRRW